VLLQEERQLIRSGLAGILAEEPRLTLLGAVRTWDELVVGCAEGPPDAVVLGLRGGADVATFVHGLRAENPGLRVVALHGAGCAELRRSATAAGVDGLVTYRAGTASIVAAVLGEPVLVENDEPPVGPLTERELQVLGHLAQGTTAAECAAALAVSRKTVDAHKQRIFAKLHVQNQAHAVALAHRMGLLGRAASERELLDRPIAIG
jgi:DNA-binding NarL/FixJ family response regulator